MMAHFFIVGLALFQPPVEIAWHTDPATASREAAARQVPVMLYFTFAECYHAKRFEKSTLRDERVLTLLGKRFVCVKLDVPQHKDVAERLGIEGFPTMVFVTAEGRKLEKLVGFQEVGAFRAALTRISP